MDSGNPQKTSKQGHDRMAYSTSALPRGTISQSSAFVELCIDVFLFKITIRFAFIYLWSSYIIFNL